MHHAWRHLPCFPAAAAAAAHCKGCVLLDSVSMKPLRARRKRLRPSGVQIRVWNPTHPPPRIASPAVAAATPNPLLSLPADHPATHPCSRSHRSQLRRHQSTPPSPKRRAETLALERQELSHAAACILPMSTAADDTREACQTVHLFKSRRRSVF